MPFDGVVAKCVAEELREKLAGGRVEKIYQPEADEIILHVRARNDNSRLVISASPNYPRIHLTSSVKENPATPPVFCMLLRKYISGGRITAIEFNDYERIIAIVIESVGELGDISEKKLIAEVMGRHSNIILTGAGNKILDSIKHVDSGISSVREVMPARTYVLPPAQDKASPDGIDTAALIGELSRSNKTTEKFLLDKIKGFSPLLCREICFRAGIDTMAVASSLDGPALGRLKNALEEMFGDIMNSRFSPCVVFEDEQFQKPVDFHCLAIKQYKFAVPYETISKAMDAFYFLRDSADRLRQKKSDLYKVLNICIERCSKKISAQQETLRETADMEKLKLFGELVTANIHAIPRNAEKVSLLNYYSKSGEEFVEIPLDPNLSPQGNAQRYFKKYAKAKSTHVNTLRQLEESAREMEYLESVLQALDNCAAAAEIDEIRQELAGQGYIRTKSKDAAKRRQVAAEPARFRSSDGFEIYVGKNNRQNDLLTFKIAKPGDIWLHARNIPGSHVIIRKTAESDIPARTLQEAAMLAAWHSRAKMSSNVPVDYTAVKNVSKPPGAKPGMVIYEKFRTLFATPDQALVEKLNSRKT